MSSVALKFDVAASRHAHQVDAICKGLGAPADEITWSYDWGVRIDGSERVDIHKGIDIFKQNPGQYSISLMGKLGRKHRQEMLDARAMAEDPAQWPLEMFEIAKPTGPSVWVWQPRRTDSPGWNEAVVVSSVTDPKTGVVEIQTKTDDGRTQAYVRLGNQWEARVSPQATRRWTAVPAESVLADLDQSCLVAVDVNVADLLRELGVDASFSPEGMDEPFTPAPGTGRRWTWGQAISGEDIAPYANLVDSLQGRSSGGLMDVLSGLANPVNHIKRQVAEDMLAGIARGQDAIEAAREAIKAHPALPSLPPEESDIAAFIESNATAAPAVGIRPIVLGRR